MCTGKVGRCFPHSLLCGFPFLKDGLFALADANDICPLEPDTVAFSLAVLPPSSWLPTSLKTQGQGGKGASGEVFTVAKRKTKCKGTVKRMSASSLHLVLAGAIVSFPAKPFERFR